MTLKTNCWWRRGAAGLLAMVAGLVSVDGVRADKPVAVIAISPVDEILGDVQYVTEAAGVGDAAGMVVAMGKGYTEGWDRKRPVGVLVSVDDQGQVKPVAFLPIKNLTEALKPLEAQIGKPRDAGDGVQELQGPQPLYLKQQKDWVFLGQSPEIVKGVTENPADVLGPVDKDYDIAVRAFVQNVPEQYKQMALGQIEFGMQNSLQRQPQETDEAFAMRKRMAETQLEQMKQLFNETDELTLGLNIDKDKQLANLDVALTAKPGTKMHNQLAGMRDNKTGFSGFISPDAAVRFIGAAKVSSDEIQQSVDMLANAREAALQQIDQDNTLPDDKAKEAAKRLLTDLLKMAEDTIRSGRMDFAASVSLQPGAANLVAGGYIVDAKRLEATVRELATMAEKEPNFPGVKFNADKHGSVAFHTMDVPVPADEDEARKIFGETLKIALGLDEKAAYIAVGQGGLDRVKKAIDDSRSAGDKPTTASEVVVSLGQILKFADSVQSNPALQAMISSLEQTKGKDQIQLRASAIDNGALYRLQVDEGVLKAIGGAVGVQRQAAAGF